MILLFWAIGSAFCMCLAFYHLIMDDQDIALGEVVSILLVSLFIWPLYLVWVLATGPVERLMNRIVWRRKWRRK